MGMIISLHECCLSWASRRCDMHSAFDAVCGSVALFVSCLSGPGSPIHCGPVSITITSFRPDLFLQIRCLLLVPLFAVSLQWFCIYPSVDRIDHRPLEEEFWYQTPVLMPSISTKHLPGDHESTLSASSRCPVCNRSSSVRTLPLSCLYSPSIQSMYTCQQRLWVCFISSPDEP